MYLTNSVGCVLPVATINSDCIGCGGAKGDVIPAAVTRLEFIEDHWELMCLHCDDLLVRCNSCIGCGRCGEVCQDFLSHESRLRLFHDYMSCDC